MEEAYRRLVLRDHVQFVAQALRSSTARGPLLDVGCGGGLFLGMMRERGFRVVGLDILARGGGHRLAAAAGAGRVRRYWSSAPLRAGQPRRPDDVPRDGASLRSARVPAAARELLAPDGRLVVQVPNAASWQARLLGSAWNGVDVPRHLFDFRDRDLERCWRACGFEVLRRKYFSLRDNPAGLASSLAPSLDPMARRVRRVPGVRRRRGWRRTSPTSRWWWRRCRSRRRRRHSAPARP